MPRFAPAEARDQNLCAGLSALLAERGRMGADEERAAAAVAADPARPEAERAAARERLVLGNLRLAMHFAERFAAGRPSIGARSLADLFQAGVLGLMRAAEDFDPAVGVRFGTYAGHWIRSKIRLELSAGDGPVRLPSWVDQYRRRYAVAARDLRQELGREPRPLEICARLEMAPRHREHALAAHRAHAPARSLSEPPTPEFDAAATLADPRSPDPAAEAEAADLRARDRRRLAEALAALDELGGEHGPRWRRVLMLRHGLDPACGGRPRTLAEVGEDLGVCKERVRQIEAAALRAARRAM